MSSGRDSGLPFSVSVLRLQTDHDTICTLARRRPFERPGLYGTVERWNSCRGGQDSIVEVSLLPSDRSFVVRMSIAAGSDVQSDVDALVRGISVNPAQLPAG